MKSEKLGAAFALISILLASTVALGADASSPSPWKAPGDQFVYAVIIIVYLGVFIAFAIVCRLLSESQNWSLATALSEEADITVADPNGQQVKKTELAASSSRLIAFVGTIAILFLFLGFGAFILWEYAETGTISNTDTIGKYLLGGLTLFAPYIVNKFSSVFAPK